MDLKLRDKKDCKYDAVSLGEVMLRFDPGEGPHLLDIRLFLWGYDELSEGKYC